MDVWWYSTLLACDLSEELTLILITVWWLWKSGRDSQCVNEKHKVWYGEVQSQESHKVEVSEEVSKSSAALEQLDDSGDINITWKE